MLVDCLEKEVFVQTAAKHQEILASNVAVVPC